MPSGTPVTQAAAARGPPGTLGLSCTRQRFPPLPRAAPVQGTASLTLPAGVHAPPGRSGALRPGADVGGRQARCRRAGGGGPVTAAPGSGHRGSAPRRARSDRPHRRHERHGHRRQRRHCPRQRQHRWRHRYVEQRALSPGASRKEIRLVRIESLSEWIRRRHRQHLDVPAHALASHAVWIARKSAAVSVTCVESTAVTSVSLTQPSARTRTHPRSCATGTSGDWPSREPGRSVRPERDRRASERARIDRRRVTHRTGRGHRLPLPRRTILVCLPVLCVAAAASPCSRHACLRWPPAVSPRSSRSRLCPSPRI